tara:strand:- start:91 stop:324 length:234 start_codon:yes stop_codon:yes gene_type:complete
LTGDFRGHFACRNDENFILIALTGALRLTLHLQDEMRVLTLLYGWFRFKHLSCYYYGLAAVIQKMKDVDMNNPTQMR